MDPGAFFIVVGIWGFAWGVVCAIIASGKNRDGFAWFFAGFLFSFFALIVVLAIQPLPTDTPAPSLLLGSWHGAPPETRKADFAVTERQSETDVPARERYSKLVEAVGDNANDRRECPHCAELIRKNAKICRFCNRDATSA